jgi:hypothetical protein
MTVGSARAFVALDHVASDSRARINNRNSVRISVGEHRPSKLYRSVWSAVGTEYSAYFAEVLKHVHLCVITHDAIAFLLFPAVAGVELPTIHLADLPVTAIAV